MKPLFNLQFSLTLPLSSFQLFMLNLIESTFQGQHPTTNYHPSFSPFFITCFLFQLVGASNIIWFNCFGVPQTKTHWSSALMLTESQMKGGSEGWGQAWGRQRDLSELMKTQPQQLQCRYTAHWFVKTFKSFTSYRHSMTSGNWKHGSALGIKKGGCKCDRVGEQ